MGDDENVRSHRSHSYAGWNRVIRAFVSSWRLFMVAFRVILRERIVWKTVQPALARLGGRDHAMTAGARVLRGMALRRAVAAERRSALLAGPQMDPLRAHLHALVALVFARTLDGGNRGDVRAGGMMVMWRLLLQYAVDERDRGGALAHRRRDAFHAAGADIAHGEDARQARLQEIRGPRQRPAGGVRDPRGRDPGRS